MEHRRAYPTPYADVNELVDTLKSAVESVLGHAFVGMYLHGSLANGGFDPMRSDIDFVVVTDSELPEQVTAVLASMPAEIATSRLRWKANFEGSFIEQSALRRYHAANSMHPVIRGDGSFGLAGHGQDWIFQRHIIRERGIVVSGPNPTTLIDPVQPDDLRHAALGILHEWWAPQITDPFRLYDSEYQAYAVLTMCRTFYTARYGQICPKPIAARYVQAVLEERWRTLIDGALAWKHGVDMNSLSETVNFIRYTLETLEGGRDR